MSISDCKGYYDVTVSCVSPESRDVGSCTTAEIMGESSLMALVGGGGGAAEKYDEKSGRSDLLQLMDSEFYH